MQVKPEQLEQQLRQQIPTLAWIAGDETLLVQEACDLVRQHAREAGFTEREVMHAGPGFDWNGLSQSAGNLSLFGDRKLIDLRLTGKLDNDGKKALQDYLSLPAGDNLLLITGPKIDKPSQSAKWFRSIESQGLFVQVWPVNARELPQWISRRMARHGLKGDQEAIALLSERVEGNLLAAAQEIEKLALLAPGALVNREVVMKSVADNARFNVFVLVDTCLEGDGARALRILRHLQGEGSEPLQVLYMLCREIRSLARMRAKVEQGQNPNGVMQAERIWSSRTRIVGKALAAHRLHDLEAMLVLAGRIDRSVKGMDNLGPWDGLGDLVLRLSNTPLSLSA